MEGMPYDWGVDWREFRTWLGARFELQDARPLNDINIVSSFSRNDVDAFTNYFRLLQEFLKEGRGGHPTTGASFEKSKRDFVSLLKAIRERPPMYLGSITFRGLSAYLAGDEHAYRRLNCAKDEGRVTFAGFKEWVEKEKNKALPRSWIKVIEFWSGGIDGGHTTKSGAFSLFFRWLDQYSEVIGKANLFHVEIDWLERQRKLGC